MKGVVAATALDLLALIFVVKEWGVWVFVVCFLMVAIGTIRTVLSINSGKLILDGFSLTMFVASAIVAILEVIAIYRQASLAWAVCFIVAYLMSLAIAGRAIPQVS